MAVIPSFTDGNPPHDSDFNFLLSKPTGGAYQTTPQAALVTGTSTLITFDTLWYDKDTPMWSAGVGSQLNFNTAGNWLVGAALLWNSNATGTRQLDIRKNSAGLSTGGIRVGVDLRNATSSGNVTNSLAVPLVGVVAGDYVQVFGSQNSGGNLALVSNNYVGAVGVWALWMGPS